MDAYVKTVQKNYRNAVHKAEDEVLFLNMRKRERNGGRFEPDFLVPYTI